MDEIKLHKCYKCKKKKSSNFFCKDKSRHSGLSSICKDCNNKRYRSRRDYFLEYQKKYQLENPEKIDARILITKLLKDGVLVRGLCMQCGSKKTVGHHPDYSKPSEVVWLCQKHHQQLHETLKIKTIPI